MKWILPCPFQWRISLELRHLCRWWATLSSAPFTAGPSTEVEHASWQWMVMDGDDGSVNEREHSFFSHVFEVFQRNHGPFCGLFCGPWFISSVLEKKRMDLLKFIEHPEVSGFRTPLAWRRTWKKACRMGRRCFYGSVNAERGIDMTYLYLTTSQTSKNGKFLPTWGLSMI